MTQERLRIIHPDDWLNPVDFIKRLKPEEKLYNKQREIAWSVRDNRETFVYAANMMGKDFIAARLAPWFFLTRHPCRIITTSAKEDHLRVLWGEMHNWLRTLRVDLSSCLVINQREIRKVIDGRTCDLSYIKGLVASPDSMAAMQGHHVADTGDGIPKTLFVVDEASSVPSEYYNMALTWAKRMLIFGNTWPCDNFFKWALKGKPGTEDKGGDILDPYGKTHENRDRYYRKTIRIKAEDSPNVIYGLAQKKAGLPPSNRIFVPGILPYSEYQQRRETRDKVWQCVSLDAEFYEGAEALLFPPEVLNHAEQLGEKLQGTPRRAKAIGIDPAEGGDRTAMAAVDDFGLIELISRRTPNTAAIAGEVLAFTRRHNVLPERMAFDRGGGGKQIADQLREQGYNVRTVAFGEPITIDLKRGMRLFPEKVEHQETHYVYVNRRAEMYGELSLLMNPDNATLPDGSTREHRGFALPLWRDGIRSLRGQLAVIPRQYDKEGRLMLPPKNRKPGEEVSELKPTLVELIGYSPDEADALVLAVHAMLHKAKRITAGAIGNRGERGVR